MVPMLIVVPFTPFICHYMYAYKNRIQRGAFFKIGGLNFLSVHVRLLKYPKYSKSKCTYI